MAETLSVVKNTMLDATQRSSSLLASGLSSLKAKVVDQHTGLGYILGEWLDDCKVAPRLINVMEFMQHWRDTSRLRESRGSM